jgi:hypothetical protein
MSSLDQLCETIDARIAELYGEMVALTTARAALHDQHAVAAAGSASTQRPTGRRSPQRADGHTADAVLQNGNGPSADVVVESSSAHGAETARPPRARAKRSRSDPAGEALLAGTLEAMLGEAEDGLSAITISKRSQAGYGKVRDLLRELESAGQVRRTGTRRTSLWRLITDEERIAERTAELENL